LPPEHPAGARPSRLLACHACMRLPQATLVGYVSPVVTWPLPHRSPGSCPSPTLLLRWLLRDKQRRLLRPQLQPSPPQRIRPCERPHRPHPQAGTRQDQAGACLSKREVGASSTRACHSQSLASGEGGRVVGRPAGLPALHGSCSRSWKRLRRRQSHGGHSQEAAGHSRTPTTCEPPPSVACRHVSPQPPSSSSRRAQGPSSIGRNQV
jgi:hypothetical protein